MANIQEIAKLAGVSSATVSRVINRKPHVSSETRAHVQKIIDQLDYVPNINAVSLKKGATKMLGIVAPTFTDSLGTFLRNFTLAAQQGGYNVTMFLTGLDKEKELEAFERLRSKQLDGLVLVIRLNEWDVLESYAKYGPIVTWQRVEDRNIQSVFMNQYDGYMLALEHLYEKGHRKIVNAYGNTAGLNTQSREKAYADFCQKYGLNPNEFNHFYNQSHMSEGETMARWWLKQENKPDAFVMATDYLASGLVTEAKRLGLSIPKDFAVVGFDNSLVAHLLDLTTIHYPIGKQGENAFIMIDNQLSKTTKPLEKLSFHLVERATT